MKTLLQRAKSSNLQMIDLRGFDEEDWCWFAKIVQHHSKVGKIFDLATIDEETLGRANLEDLKIVWEAIYEEGGRFEIMEEDDGTVEICMRICEEDVCPNVNDNIHHPKECGWKTILDWIEDFC